jgi:hypothetical protein
MGKVRNEEKWREIIRKRVDSGLSMKVWCSQNNIKLSAFKYRDNKFKKAEKTSTGWTSGYNRMRKIHQLLHRTQLQLSFW